MRTLQDWIRFAASTVLLVAISFSLAPAQAQEDGDDTAAIKSAERFLTVLERNPRRGVALDRVYDHHLERGTLDELARSLQARTERDPADGTAWMLIGLLESKRGREGESIEAFQKAVELRPADPVAPLYLGQAYVVAGQTDRAAEAYEQGIARKPSRQEALELFGALGRVHLRAGQSSKALDAWTRLEAVVPDDRNVQEEIAATLAAEGQLDLALPRYRTLAASAREESQKALYRIEIADILARQNQTKEAIAEFDSLLATLNPEGWLYRDIRSRVDQTFLKSSDLDGLTRYYTVWIEKHPEDIDAMSRLARLLLRQARTPEARGWLEKALKLAPSRTDLRRSLIDQFVEEQDYAAALAQYAALDQTEPGNPDTLREWGKLILRDRSRPREEREKAAEAVWRRLLAARPTDALAAIQVADLLRHAEMMEAAEALYRKGVELAPTEPQYREYLGEFYHLQKRKPEALATWNEIVAGDRRSAPSLARLAEVLASFGYLAEAIPQAEAACALDPRDLPLRLKTAQLQAKGGKLEAALTTLSAAESLAQDEEERELIVEGQLRLYEQEESLERRATALATELTAGQGTPRGHYLLARIREAERKWTEALAAIEAARKAEPKSLPVLIASARIAEQGGRLQEGIDRRRALAELDRRGRSEHLRRIAELELQLGHKPASLQAARELVASAPGNTENQEFLAGLCFRVGETEEGLQTLRKAIRLNPDEPALRLTLASHLAERFRTQEAIEIYWQAFDKASQLDDKLAVILKLTELSNRTSNLPKLFERLQSLRRSVSDKRELTLCIAQAHHASGDLAHARRELEAIVDESSRDTPLLQQLSKLSESDGDLPAAIRYQRRLVELAPGPDTEFRLAVLLSRTGKTEESSAIYVRLAGAEKDPESLLKVIDSLLAQNQGDTVRAILQSQRSRDDRNWELLYREGVALGPKSIEEATRRFEAILALSLDDEEPGIAAKNRQRRSPGGASPPSPQASQMLAFGMYTMASRVRQSIQPVRLVANAPASVQYWTPANFGEARMGALAWLYDYANRGRQGPEFLRRFQIPAERDDATERQLWDYAYLTSVSTGGLDRRITPLARRLAQTGRPAGELYFLQQLYLSQIRSNSASQVTPVLTQGDLDLASQALRNLTRASRDGNRPQVAPMFASIVLRELDQNNRSPEAVDLFKELVDVAAGPSDLAMLIAAYPQSGELEPLLTAFGKFSIAAATAPSLSASYSQMISARLADQIPRVEGPMRDETILSLVDHVLDGQQRLRRAGPRPGNTSSRTMPNNVTVQMINGTLVQTTTGTSNRRFPPPNSVLDEGALTLLDRIYSTFQSRSLADVLRKRLEQRLETAAEGDKALEHFALACFWKWSGSQENAREALDQSMEAAPRDTALWLDMVRIHIQASEWSDAAKRIEQINPTDLEETRERELLALDIAARLGDNEMGKRAAERLLGMRLDFQIELRIATQMKRMGMQEEAETVLARSRASAGNQPQSLLILMQTATQQGNMDLAEEIALQILQRTPSAPAGNPALPRGAVSGSAIRTVNGTVVRTQGGAPDAIRAAALEFLTTSKRLDGLIARSEERLKQSPNAIPVYEELAELYRANKQPDKVREVYRKLIEIKPEDTALLSRLAINFQTAGMLSEACDAYLLLLKQNPSQIHALRVQIFDCFAKVNRTADLATFLESIDAPRLGSMQSTDVLIRSMVNSRELRPAAVSLLRKGWAESSEQRGSLLAPFVGQGDLWKTDEFLDYGTRALIPTPAEAVANPWFGLAPTSGGGSEAQMFSLFQSLIVGAQGANRLDRLQQEVTQGLSRAPEWRAGPLVIAVLEAAAGKVDAAAATIDRVAGAKNAEAVPYGVAWVVGQVLEQNAPARALAVPLYRVAVEQIPPNDPQYQNRWEIGPGARLLKLLDSLNRRDELRDVLLRAAALATGTVEAKEFRSESLVGVYQAGLQLENLRFPFEAWQVYRGIIEQPAPAAIGNPFAVSSEASFRREARQRLGRLTESLATSHSAELLRSLLPPADSKRERGVNLMLTQSAGTDGQIAFTTPWTAILASRARLPAMIGGDRKTLEELAARYPDQVEPRMLAAIHALAAKEPEPIEAALGSLRTFLEAHPDPAVEAGRPVEPAVEVELRQRMGLWLIAVEALVREESRAEGRWLAGRAIDAARRLSLRPETQMMLEGGIRLTVEARLREDLERFLRIQIEVATQNPGSVEPKPGRPLPLTEPQFQIVLRSTLTAVENDLPNLAGEGLRTAFAGGMPVPEPVSLSAVPPAPPTAVTFGSSSPASVARMQAAVILAADADPSAAEDTLRRTVRMQMHALSRVWQEKELPAEAFYDTLHLVVLDPAGSRKVTLHEDPSADAADPQSLGRDLARWAVRSGRTEPLEAELAELAKTSGSTVPAQSLRAILAIETGDRKRAEGLLKDLTERLAKPDAADLAMGLQAAGQAWSDERLRPAAMPLMELSAKRYAGKQSLAIRGPVRLLADHYVSLGLKAELAELLDGYLKQRESLHNWSNQSTDPLLRTNLRRALDYAGAIGDADWTLERLWQYHDLPNPEAGTRLGIRNNRVVDVAASEEGTRLDALPPLRHASRQLAALPAVDRYEKLRDWVLPSSRYRALREIQGFAGGDEGNGETPPAGGSGSFGTLTLLVSAARDANRLDDLRKALANAHQVKESDAALQCLKDLVGIASGASAPVEIVANMMEKTPLPEADSGRVRGTPFHEYLLAEAALAEGTSKEARLAGRRLAELLLKEKRSGYVLQDAHLQRLLALDRIRDLPADERRQLVAPSWSSWTAEPSELSRALGHPDPWWIGAGDRLAHLSGANLDPLTFRWPVTGTFQFSFEAPASIARPPVACYGGLHQTLQTGSDPKATLAFGPSRAIEPADLLPDGWIRYTVKVTPENVRYLAGDRLLYEDERPQAGQPWLSLVVRDSQRMSLRNPRWSGQPTIPREIALLPRDNGRDETIPGWRIDPQTQVLLRLASPRPTPVASTVPQPQPLPPALVSKTPVAWHLANGILRGPVIPRSLPVPARGPGRAVVAGNLMGKGAQLLAAHPLQRGEGVTYEFFYEPGTCEVDPVLGPWIFQLAPDGVRVSRRRLVHTTNQGTITERMPLPASPQYRKGDGPLPLKAKEWNTVRLERAGDQVCLTLNGQLIYERPWEAGADPSFGFSYECHEVRAEVRNVVLTGDWPQEFGDLAAPLLEQAGDATLTPAGQEARTALLKWAEEAPSRE